MHKVNSYPKIELTLYNTIWLYWKKRFCKKHLLVSIMTILDFYAWELAWIVQLWIHHITWDENISITLVSLCWFFLITFWLMVGCWKKCTCGLQSMSWNWVEQSLHINLLYMKLEWYRYCILVLWLSMVWMVHRVKIHFNS